MSDFAIQVDNVGKLYRLGEVGTGTISHDLNRWMARVRGKEDPFAKIGEVNDRTVKGDSDYVWALKDISFEVKRGEAVGIIGRNGAGKSTLLKILSKVTTPSTGEIKVSGRIASLLEVGTGFHPELTGRDNIYLNGAILGMKKKEIKRKFDEIVAFSGVDRYIDTPVKRYSSGMYVRLAFAVAAHLESEILIIDEVLAVGDAEFQKKCLGKMNDVSKNEGRTVLFVSHNMGAIRTLCTSGVYLENGTVHSIGLINEVVDFYLKKGTANNKFDNSGSVTLYRTGTGAIVFDRAIILDEKGVSREEFFIGDTMQLEFAIKNPSLIKSSSIGIQIKDLDEIPLMHMMNIDSGFELKYNSDYEGYRVTIKDLPLFPGDYKITLTLASTGGHDVYDNLDGCLGFTILDGGEKAKRKLPKQAGIFFLQPDWEKILV